MDDFPNAVDRLIARENVGENVGRSLLSALAAHKNAGRKERIWRYTIQLGKNADDYGL